MLSVEILYFYAERDEEYISQCEGAGQSRLNKRRVKRKTGGNSAAETHAEPTDSKRGLLSSFGSR